MKTYKYKTQEKTKRKLNRSSSKHSSVGDFYFIIYYNSLHFLQGIYIAFHNQKNIISCSSILVYFSF